MEIVIAPAGPADEADWRRMFAGYCAFYRVDLAEATVAETWRRILDPAEPTHGLIARDGVGGPPLGLTNYILHQNTWSPLTDCYLEDLFTLPEARGRGVGRALIERLASMGRAAGWRRVYWLTAEDNTTARRLYDAVTGGRDGFIRYSMRLD